MISVSALVTGTGPISATVSPMEVDLVFRGARFGKLQLPQIMTRPGGSRVEVRNQTVRVLDLAAFRAFVRSAVDDEWLVLTLDNGPCSVSAVGVTGRCVYRKDVRIRAMGGLAARVVDVSGVLATFVVTNPSPMEIDHGVSVFDVQGGGGEVFARLRGPVAIRRGKCEVTMAISREPRRPTSTDARLVGVRTENEAWTTDTIKFIQMPLELTERFLLYFSPF